MSSGSSSKNSNTSLHSDIFLGNFISCWKRNTSLYDLISLTHYHTILHFDALKIYSFGNIVRKGEIACYKQFLLFSQCFLAYRALIFHFKCTLKCCLQFVSIWTSLKFCHLVMGYRAASVFQTCNKQFLLFSPCFLSYKALIFHFKCTLKYRLQFVSIWTILKFCHLVMG